MSGTLNQEENSMEGSTDQINPNQNQMPEMPVPIPEITDRVAALEGQLTEILNILREGRSQREDTPQDEVDDEDMEEDEEPLQPPRRNERRSTPQVNLATQEEPRLRTDLPQRQRERYQTPDPEPGTIFDPVQRTIQSIRNFRRARSRYAVEPNVREDRPIAEPTTHVMNKASIKMKTFHGEYGPKVMDWLTKYSQFAAISGWNQQQMLGAIQFYLEGPAESWWLSSRKQWEDWEALCQEMTATFYPPEYEEEMERELMQCVQKNGETVDEYRWRLETLCHQAEDPHRPMTAIEIGRRFKAGLRYRYRQHIESMPPSTIEQYATVARRFEKSDEDYQQKNKREGTGRKRSPERNGRNSEENKPATDSRPPPRRDDQREQRPRIEQRPNVRSDNQSVRSPTCFKCNEVGHYSFNCPLNGRPNPPPNQNPPPRPEHRVNHVDEREAVNMVDSTEQPAKPTDPQRTERYIPAMIQVQTPDGYWNAIVDTGSSISLVELETLKQTSFFKIICETWEKEKGKNVVTANGGDLATYGTIQFPFKIQDRFFTHTLVVASGLSSKLIFGMDFLISHPVQLDLVNRTFAYEGLQIPLQVKRGNKEMDDTYDGLNGLFVEDLPLGVTLAADGHDNEDLQLLADSLRRNADVFSADVKKPPTTHLLTVKIPTGDHPPIYQLPYRKSHAEEAVIQAEIREMILGGIIEPCASPWASPVVIVDKPDGSKRFCVDYKKLNSITKSDVYPLPRIDDQIDELKEYTIFSTMDLVCGYWQFPMDIEDMDKTAFICRAGLYRFRKMPFGLKNAPAIFQRTMNHLLQDLIAEKKVKVYLDDVLVYSKTMEEHVVTLERVFTKLREAGLQLKGSKCKFGKRKIVFLGFTIENGKLMPRAEKIDTIWNFPQPANLRKLRRFLGMCGFYRKFIQNFSDIVVPLNKLLKKGAKWSWEREQQEAFDTLKKQMCSEPVLVLPDFTRDFILTTDASGTGLGAILSQKNADGDEQVIAYASRTLNKAELSYSTTEKECLAVVWGAEYFRPYLFGRPFTVITDHAALTWIMSYNGKQQRLLRWSLRLQEFDYQIVYRPGKVNEPADALSRLDEPEVVNLIQKRKIDEMQKKDESLKVILEKAKDGMEEFYLEKGTLFKRAWNKDGDNCSQLVLPRELRSAALEECHDSRMTGGHLGEKKTIKKLLQRYWWPNIRKDTIHWIKSCKICAKLKKPNQMTFGELQSIPVGDPWDLIGMDILGPLPESKNKKKYILVVCDYLTKWTEAFALPNQKSETIAKILIEEIFCRHGVPNKIMTDRGNAFLSDLMKEIWKIFEVKKINTSAYHPQTDGLVERFNRTLAKMLAAYVEKNQKDWDEHLPYVLFAYRTAEQSSTKEEPFFLMYGRRSRYPLQISYTPHNETVRQMKKNLEEAWELAREEIQKSQQNQKRNHDKRTNPQIYSLGDKVMIYVPERKKGIASKLASRWIGPMEIVKSYGNNHYLVRDLEKGTKRYKYNGNLMKIYHEREEIPNITSEEEEEEPDLDPQVEEDTGSEMEVEEDDEEIVPEDEFEVETILGKRSKKQPDGKYLTEYLVKWRGYPDDQNTWEPWKNINAPEKLAEFRSKTMRSENRKKKETAEENHLLQQNMEPTSPTIPELRADLFEWGTMIPDLNEPTLEELVNHIPEVSGIFELWAEQPSLERSTFENPKAETPNPVNLNILPDLNEPAPERSEDPDHDNSRFEITNLHEAIHHANQRLRRNARRERTKLRWRDGKIRQEHRVRQDLLRSITRLEETLWNFSFAVAEFKELAEL